MESSSEGLCRSQCFGLSGGSFNFRSVSLLLCCNLKKNMAAPMSSSRATAVEIGGSAVPQWTDCRDKWRGAGGSMNLLQFLWYILIYKILNFSLIYLLIFEYDFLRIYYLFL